MKCPGSDKQHVVGIDGAVFGINRAAFHDGQQVALHTFATNIGATAAFLATGGDLIDLVYENNS